MSNGACTVPTELVRVSFTLAAPGARSVSLALFLDPFSLPAADPSRPYSSDRHPPLISDMMRLAQAEPGVWRGEIDLRPGRCEYAFLVDGAWVPDPAAATSCPDGAGGRNSIRMVPRPAPAAAGASRHLPPAARAGGMLRAV